MAKSIEFTTPVVATKLTTGANGTTQVQLEQVVTTTYGGSIARGITSNSLLGAGRQVKESQSFETIRRAWLDEDLTVEETNELLEECPNAKIIRVISVNPEDVMSDGQLAALNSGLIKRADLLKRLVDINPSTKKPVLYRGMQQYSRLVFHDDATGDIDKCQEAYERLVTLYGEPKEAFSVNVAKPAQTADAQRVEAGVVEEVPSQPTADTAIVNEEGAEDSKPF